jgi:hypothetical protein
LMMPTRCLPFGASVGAGFELPTPHDIEAALGACGTFQQGEASAAWYTGNLVVCFRDDAPRSLVDRFASYWADLAR